MPDGEKGKEKRKRGLTRVVERAIANIAELYIQYPWRPIHGMYNEMRKRAQREKYKKKEQYNEKSKSYKKKSRTNSDIYIHIESIYMLYIYVSI